VSWRIYALAFIHQSSAAGISVLYYKPITALSLLDTYHNITRSSVSELVKRLFPIAQHISEVIELGAHTHRHQQSKPTRRVLHFDFFTRVELLPAGAFIFGAFKILSV